MCCCVFVFLLTKERLGVERLGCKNFTTNTSQIRHGNKHLKIQNYAVNSKMHLSLTYIVVETVEIIFQKDK